MGEGGDVMVEAFMKGTEITCGCYKTKEKQPRSVPHHRSRHYQ
jgi:D-alanine-D-alanine ligase-like ATP-grasp enzyme